MFTSHMDGFFRAHDGHGSCHMVDLMALRTVEIQEPTETVPRWPPPYFLVPPDRARLHHFCAVLGDAAHGNPLKAWFRVLDPDQSFRITFNRFKYQLMRFQKLQEEDSMAQVWRAWDSDCSGYLFLRRFHPEAHEAAARLKRWAAKSGGGVKFISQLESNNGRVSKATFRKALADVLDHAAADLLFDGLDVGDTGHLTEQEVRCLDRWDLAFEDELHSCEAT